MTPDTYLLFVFGITGFLIALLVFFGSRMTRPKRETDIRVNTMSKAERISQNDQTAIGVHYFFKLISFAILDILIIILILFALIAKKNGLLILGGLGLILVFLAAGFLFVNRQAGRRERPVGASIKRIIVNPNR